MKPGELTAQGTLFVRGPVYQARTSSGAMQYQIPMLERRGAGVQQITGVWLGPEADSFMREFGGSIKPGKALTLSFSKLWVHNNELHGVINSARNAPDRWESNRPSGPTGDCEREAA